MLVNKSLMRLSASGCRNFSSITQPMKTMHFINHPRYGSVYPIVTLDKNSDWVTSGRVSTVGFSAMNTLIVYSTLVQPIFNANIAAFVANPLFLIPSLAVNYLLYQFNRSYFRSDKSLLRNLYLKPNGKQVIYETRDGTSKTVNTIDIYEPVLFENRYESLISFGHGANVYVYLRGNSHIFDSWCLTAVLENKFIDAKNVAYDFDVTKEFTWEFRDLVEIKKRRRIINRYYQPTMKLFKGIDSAKKFERNRSQGITNSKMHNLENYNLYEYVSDWAEVEGSKEDQDIKKAQKQHELNVKNAGREIIEQKAASETQGRRVRRMAM